MDSSDNTRQSCINLEGVQLELRHIPGPSERAPIVFLHEGLGCVGMWSRQGSDWPALLCAATGRAGWLYSRRGYGASDPIAHVRQERQTQERAGLWHSGRHGPDYMHREASDVLPQLLHKLGVQRPVLLGHSDGATIALLHASAHPVSACIAMAAHLFVEPMTLRAIEQARSAFLDPSPTGLRQRLARYHRDVDNAFWQWNDIWLSPSFASFDITPQCRAITCPLLALQGQNDEYGSLEQLNTIRSAVPSATTLSLSDCRHSPHFDQPQTLTRAIAELLQSCV